jgi:cytochrome c553
MDTRKKKIIISILIAIIIGVVLIIILVALANYNTSQYSSNGERIYYTGITNNGEEIHYSGGMMMRMSCADCHGDTGEGGFNIMMYDVTSTDIRYDVLTRAYETKNESEDGHHNHIPYNDTTIKAAITTGVEPDGEELSLAMPRWRLSDDDLDDLLDYLKTLNSTNTNKTRNTGGSSMIGGCMFGEV